LSANSGQTHCSKKAGHSIIWLCARAASVLGRAGKDPRNGCYRTSGGRTRYSGLMLAVRITMAHFSVSATTSLLKSEGDPGNTSAPSSAKRAFSVGCARPALISLLRVSMIVEDVLRGATTPYHVLAS